MMERFTSGAYRANLHRVRNNSGARDHGVGVTAHMSADPADPDYDLAATGKRPITHLATLAASGTHVTHCPMTAMKGAYGATHSGRFPEMAAAGVPIQSITIDEERLYARVEQIAPALIARAGKTVPCEWPVQ